MTDEFDIRPDAVRSIAGNIGGLLMQTVAHTRDLARLDVPAAAYGQIGADVATAGGALGEQQTVALQSLLKVVGDIGSRLREVADSADRTDSDIAAGLWGSAGAVRLARSAMDPVPAADPVSAVLSRIHQVGVGQTPSGQFGSPAAFADWLDADPDHQTSVGVIGIYSGGVGRLSDVPGGLHPGDVVFRSHWQLGPDLTGGDRTDLGIVGSDGRLYDNGVPVADGVAELRVDRPLDA